MFIKKIAGCIIIQEEKILLIKKKSRHWFELPGGSIEENETAEDAAKREMKEEISCDVEILSLYQEKEFEHKHKKYHSTWFLAKLEENQTPRIGEPQEYEDLQYIPLEDLSNYTLSPIIEELLSSLQLNEA